MPGPWERYQRAAPAAPVEVPANAEGELPQMTVQAPPEDGPWAKYQAAKPEPAPEEPGIVDQLRRTGAGALRNVVHGAASIPGLINDPIVHTLNWAEEKAGVDPKYRFGTAGQAADLLMSKAGVPEYTPQSATERVVGRVEQGLGGMVAGMGAGGLLSGTQNAAAQTVGSALTSGPGAQTVAAVAGSGAGGIAHEAGASPRAELLWSLLGGVTPAATAAGGMGLAAAARRGLGASDEAVQLAQRAQAAGIPLKASQITDSKLVKLFDSASGQIPFSGAQKFQNAQQRAFNAAVARTIGEDANAITPEVFASAKARIGQSYDDLAQRVQTKVTPDVQQKIAAVLDHATQMGAEDSGRAVANIAKRIQAQTVNGELPGQAYKSIDSELGAIAKNGGEKGNYASQLREILRDAFSNSAGPADRAQMQLANQQYRDLKTIEPLVAKDATDGNISSAQLLGRVNATKAGKGAMATGRRGDLGDLANIGSRLLKDKIPDSGTAQRLMAMNALKGVGLAAAGYGAHAVANPEAAIITMLGTLTGGRSVQKLLQSEAFVNALLKRKPAVNPVVTGIGTSINPTQAITAEQR